jgi:hypothetical protein
MISGLKEKMRAAATARFAGVLLVSTLAGCIHVDQTLVLEKDGSGTIDLTYGMSEESILQWQGVASHMLDSSGMGNASPMMPFDFSDEDIRTDFKEFEQDGVVLQSIKTETRDSWKSRRMIIRFRSLAGLAKAGFLADRNLSLVKDSRGNYVFLQQGGRNGNLPPELAAWAKTSADSLLSDMMKGFKAVIRVKTPGRILETNASDKKDRTAMWTYDLDRDPNALQKAQWASLRVVFDGKGLNIPSFRRE